jgi:hypothetical protein
MRNGLRPIAFLQMPQSFSKLFTFVRADLSSFSFSAARHNRPLGD